MFNGSAEETQVSGPGGRNSGIRNKQIYPVHTSPHDCQKI